MRHSLLVACLLVQIGTSVFGQAAGRIDGDRIASTAVSDSSAFISAPTQVAVKIETDHEKATNHDSWDGTRRPSVIISHFIVPMEGPPDVYAIGVYLDGSLGRWGLCPDSYLCRLDLEVPSDGVGLLFFDKDFEHDDLIDGLILLPSLEGVHDGTAARLNQELVDLAHALLMGDEYVPFLTSPQDSLVPRMFRAVVVDSPSETRLQQSTVSVWPVDLGYDWGDAESHR